MSHEKIADAIETSFGIRGSIRRLAGENENYLIELADGEQFVLKITAESYGRDRILLEHAAVEAIYESGMNLALPRLVPDVDGNFVTSLDLNQNSQRLCRLLKYNPGDPWYEKGSASDELLKSGKETYD